MGEAPSSTDDGSLGPFGGRRGSARRLAELLGVERVQDAAVTLNLFDRTPDRWVASEARGMAEWLLHEHPEPRLRWLLCGRRVAAAFGLAEADWLAWLECRRRWMAVVPHPSGRSRWWNDEKNLARAGSFLREAAVRHTA